MSGIVYAILLILAVSFVIVVIAFLVLLIKGIIKRHESSGKKYVCAAFIILGVWILAVVGLDLKLRYEKKEFENIPGLSVDGNRVTILNEGSSSMGSFCTYVMSSEGAIQAVNQISSNFFMGEKFGYVFQIVTDEQVYLAVFENDCGKISYVDVYNINPINEEEKAVCAEHIKVEDLNETITHLVDDYGFSEDELEEEYAYYLTK